MASLDLPVAGVWWGHYRLSTNQTAVSIGATVQFDEVVSGTIPLTDYTFTLPASGVYRLSAACRLWFSSSSGGTVVKWFDVTNNQYVESQGTYNAQTSTSNRSNQPLAVTYASVTDTARLFQLRIMDRTDLSYILASDTFAEIQKIG